MATLKWKTGELFAQLKKVRERSTREMAGAAKDVIDRFHNKMVHERLSIHGPNSLGARTGQLKEALKGEVKIRSKLITGRVFFRGKKANMIANVHEGKRGRKYTIIKPKGAWLKVPLPSALTPTGRLKGRFKGGKKKGQFIRRSKAGNLIIFDRTGKGKRGKLTPIFVLKKRVKIPKRLFMLKTWRKFRREAKLIIRAAQHRAYRRGA
jgi:hypothetical protein